MAKVTKRVLAQIVADDLRCTMTLAKQMVDALFGGLTDSLSRGERVEIRGFGAFTVRMMSANPAGRNPATGQRVYVPARRKVHFRPGRLIRSAHAVPIRDRDGLR